MELTVLAVPDCPNALVLEQRLAGLPWRAACTKAKRAAWKALQPCPRCAGCWNKPVREVCRRRL